jgi:phospholipid transport system substrate-binding protein
MSKLLRRFSIGSAWVVLLGLAQYSFVPVAAAAAPTASAIDPSSPSTLIDSASKYLLADLEANRAAYRKDPAKLYKLVNEAFLPHFDVDFSAQQVLGVHWRDASPEQRKRFISSFANSMLQNYGDALVDFTADQMKVLPFQGDATAPRASVRSQIRRSNGNTVAVNYSLRKTADGQWKVWDVVIEGISYVKSFREDLGSEVDQKGLEAVIKRLESKSAAKSGA